MDTGLTQTRHELDRGGFTLIELIIIIVVLGILATVAIPKFSNMSTSAKVTATKEELNTLKRALVGNPSVVAGGTYVDRGFEGDVGYLPSQLADLVAKPDSIAAYNPLTRLGWNGPYVDGSNGDYLTDAWGVGYAYDPVNRLLRSTGGGPDSVRASF
ncbi:MAG: prepilin-type N-terminal cleavage/methylation domain-containing protein [Candidatus Zixiibacteriota bacterium]